ncbi:MAG: FAD-dependent oxidoreductase [Actinomycetaceae bacterium]|nr:FAD-dependent oxidoreductase [Actinomycetaceae bacterium]MDO5747012.1 FAD-dependent oxidoreductase [Actinomycetaceae bacterium]
MDDELCDVVVVGAGIAGTLTAILLAREGKEVYLLERGKQAGDKNLSGGVFYCRVMEQIFPDFVDKAPIERVITRNTLGVLTSDSYIGLDYRDKRLATPVNAVSVLRAKLDSWLAEQAEEEGVMYMPEAKVDALLRDGKGAVTGVQVGEDEVPARIVVSAEGVNSFLAREAGLRRDQETHELAVGVKSLWKLGRDTINERFNVSSQQGAAYALVGDCTRGVAGGGFLYTNSDTVSIGVVLRLDSLTKSGFSSSDIHDYFVQHDHIQQLLQGGELVEYGCHMVNEGGLSMLKPMVKDGFVAVGDAAGLTLNTGLTIRGMDLAAASAQAAATGICQALDSGDYSARGLIGYPKAFKDSWAGQDMLTYRDAPSFFDNDRIYHDYGPVIASILYNIYCHDLTPRTPLRHLAVDAFKNAPFSVSDFVRDMYGGMTSL